MKNIILEDSWMDILKNEFDKEYMIELLSFLDTRKDILPTKELWFNALNSTKLKDIKVVIIGQDPYPTEGHAHGLCFSVLPEVKPLPKSLLNINKELISDLNIDNSLSGNLQSWADQGVLMLNSVLTVEKGQANIHQGKGWELFTSKIIELINENCENVVFILWGGYAQKKGSSINEDRHLVIKSPHPSPLSSYRGFFGSKPFSKTNNYLKIHNKKQIDWKNH